MKTRTMQVALVVLLRAGMAWGASDVRGGEDWNDQLHEMGYLILHISGVNVINGLNLTREQAVKLRDMAKRVEAVAPKKPSMKAAAPADTVEIRDTYLELEKKLLAQEEITPALERKVGLMRVREANLIRDSLDAADAGGNCAAGCMRCHFSPYRNGPSFAGDGANRPQRKPVTPFERKAIFHAHLEGHVGRSGSVLLATMAKDVDEVLTDAQRDIVGKFSCCLVPPKSLSDPVRAGQASAPEGALKLLRSARDVPDARWPAARSAMIELMAVGAKAKSPSVTDEALAAERARVRELLDKVRAMTDVEFEMNKESLAAEVKGQGAGGQSEGVTRFMTAYFLLQPGNVEVYDAVLRRLDAAAKSR